VTRAPGAPVGRASDSAGSGRTGRGTVGARHQGMRDDDILLRTPAPHRRSVDRNRRPVARDEDMVFKQRPRATPVRGDDRE